MNIDEPEWQDNGNTSGKPSPVLGCLTATLGTVVAVPMLLLIFAVGSCTLRSVLGSYSLHYRMTVIVETPEGIKTGTVVRGVKVSYGWGFDGWEHDPRLDGEAVAVDLGQRGVLFGLISDANGYGMELSVPPYTFPFSSETPVGTKVTLAQQEYPEFVHFQDLKDPTTIKSVPLHTTSSEMDDTFGSGVRVKEVTIEKTNDPITTGVEKYLPWLSCMRENLERALDRLNGNGMYSLHPIEEKPYKGLDLFKFEKTDRDRSFGQKDDQSLCSSILAKKKASDQAQYQAALMEWKPLADRGNAEAQRNMGMLYEGCHIDTCGESYGVAVRWEEAAKWFRRAADQGNLKAQLSLGRMYEQGKGVRQDFVESYFWLLLASKQDKGPGHEYMPEQNAKHHLSQDQIMAVEKRVVEWKPVEFQGQTPN